jgi:cold shock CspA family protein
MSTNTDNVTTLADSSRFIGRVKWFNNKAGYGFITVTDGDKAGSDIFTHHSVINVENNQYKYLVQGEYVEFSLDTTTAGKYEVQAANVSGIKGGKLMCETRHEFKVARNNYKSEKFEKSEEVSPVPRQQRVPSESKRPPRARGEGPRETTEEKKQWTLVNNKSAPRGRPKKVEKTVV